MLAGLYRLKHLGITQLTLPASISSALTQLPDEAIALAAASHIERELLITPWNLSSNFVSCTSQVRSLKLMDFVSRSPLLNCLKPSQKAERNVIS